MKMHVSMNKNWKILGGAKITYGVYPYGNQTRLYPLLDIIYKWY